jgi:glycosyltransferase involved in cell wall biosynthesis
MRILVANHHRTLVGGIETYLRAIMARLASAGHTLLFVHEASAAQTEELIPLPPGCEAIEHSSDVMGKLRAWKPDLAYIHALHNLDFEQQLIENFTSVAFAHGYYGLCISGSKTWRRASPCQKQFDWRCLLHFHAKQCGGSNPITMMRDFRRQSHQLKLLRRCEAVLTHSGQIQREYLAQGIKPDRLFTLPHFVEPPTVQLRQSGDSQTVALIYIGRFDTLKGGHLLLQALPEIGSKLGKRVLLRMLGSGPAASEWKSLAQRIAAANIQIEFPGWVSRERKDALLAESDLVVVPSIWPEPFGQVGLEANQLGVAAVAFELGGIPNWLRDGINGHVAPLPPSASGVAEAIVKSLGNPAHYAKLRDGAMRVASEFSIDKHMAALMSVFEKALQRRR